MREMVINFFPDGTIQHTLKDSFLKPFGKQKREIKRMSEIEHVTDQSMFGVKPLFPCKHLKDGLITYNTLAEYELHSKWDHPIMEEPVLRVSYEDAVAVEIDLINAMRLRGLRI